MVKNPNFNKQPSEYGNPFNEMPVGNSGMGGGIGGMDAGPQNLQQCHSCGRSFNEVALQKHSKICKKVFVNKRKEFNA
jgi:hypothetical protein